jgi:hypothetical protein
MSKQKTLNEQTPEIDLRPTGTNFTIPLLTLQARYLEPSPGKTRYMRMLQAGEDLNRARAIYFRCPQCGVKHMITLPFGFSDVPANLQPPIRCTPMNWPVQMNGLTIREGVTLPCGITGYIQVGQFNFRRTS